MKLSDAIQLGRMVMHLIRGVQNDGQDGGCAIGIGLRACGLFPSKSENTDLETFEAAIEAWPWLQDPVSVPCSELICAFSGYEMNYAQAIAHTFDHHVFGQGDWTLDQLVTWIQSVEPAEPESLDIANLDLAALLANATEMNPA